MSIIEFDMVTAVNLLNLPCDSSRISDNIECPVCYETHGKKKLNINFRKNVFRCAKCGVNGGVIDLVKIFTGSDHDKAVKLIYKRYQAEPNEQIVYAPKEEIMEAPLADIELRDKVYTKLLSKLNLNEKHRKDLNRRGLSDDQIQKLGYKSAPIYPETLNLPRIIVEEGLPVAGVPGFCKTKKGNKWWFINENSGILIPVRDMEGKIQGLKIRLDNTEEGKFRWISSRGRCGGAGAENWIHFTGFDSVGDTAIITEGPMKGDISSLLACIPVIAIAGVNSIEKLEDILPKMQKRGVHHYYICFDMDLFSNPHVQTGLQNLCEMLSKNDCSFKIVMWDKNFKGIDDYLTSN